MRHLMILAGLAFLIASCSEKETEPPSKTDLITSGAWKYESGGVDMNRDGTIDATFETLGFPACRLDNTGTFNSNGTGLTDEGATKCNSADPQTLSFTWSFAVNETKLNIGGTGLFGVTGQFNLATLTTSKMTVTKDTSISSFNASLIVNLKH